MVYVIQALMPRKGAPYIVKIGRTGNISERLTRMRVESPVPLKLLGFIESSDDVKKEREFHDRFADHRIHGEWFEMTKATLGILKRLIVGC